MLSKDPALSATNASTQQSLYGWRDIDGGLVSTWADNTGFSSVVGQRYERFIRPVQVAARGNFVFVVDAGTERLYRYDLSRNELTVLLNLKKEMAGEASDLYVFPDHSFLLVDPDSASVLHYNHKGDRIRVFQDSLNLIRPVAVTYDDEMGRVLIADGSSDDVLVFSTTGQLQGVIGTRGVEEGQFLNITAMTSGADGIYVTARLGHRLQLMGRDGSHLKSFQSDAVVFPLAVAVDRSGNTFVSDYLDNSIKVFQGELFLESIAGSGITPGRFKRISDLWYDEGFLYAVDSLNGRIQVLRVEVIEPEIETFAEEEVAPTDVGDQAAAAEALPLDVPSADEELEAAQNELEELEAELEAARLELEAGQAEPAQVIDSPSSETQE
ncbi:hypothetical protein MNBD_GAMMA17-77 [hydrothermal vent metagenome]|uniref:Uncharacterized protein n=1 Tax=hydrothermal vent metagenome TaxID=652676 RepID=A0A3B1A3T3_9ZZZZ